jgi:hypothetical protein
MMMKVESASSGALLIEPFEVSRWRGVSNSGFMGFESSGEADV